MSATDYDIAKIRERTFFIKKKRDREKMELLCAFANSVGCTTFQAATHKVHSIGDDYVVQSVVNGHFEALLNDIFKRTLWSEDL